MTHAVGGHALGQWSGMGYAKQKPASNNHTKPVRTHAYASPSDAYAPQNLDTFRLEDSRPQLFTGKQKPPLGLLALFEAAASR